MTKGQAMIFKTLHIYNQDWATQTPLKTFKILSTLPSVLDVTSNLLTDVLCCSSVDDSE
jgi:hypothetical protein